MRILVTFALENEFAAWRARRKFRRAQWDGVDVFAGEIEGAEVGVVFTGAGPRMAGRSASKIFRNASDAIQFCVTSGFAGGLRPEYQIGQILAARRVYSESSRAADGNSWIASSNPLLVSASECAASTVDRFYTSEHVVNTSEEKHHLGNLAEAVEMESFEIMREAAAKGVPVAAIRAISDTVDDDLPLDMSRVFSDEGKVSIGKVIGQVALRPQAVPGLVRLGQQGRRAAESLGEFLDRYISILARQMNPLTAKGADTSRPARAL